MNERGQRKERVGIVISDKMDKTVVVTVERSFLHPVYGRIVRKNSKYIAHDGKDECRTGDKVRITETRPLSKTKHWRVCEVLERAK